MKSEEVIFRYYFNLKEDNAQEVLDYFNGSGFSQYMGSRQDVGFKNLKSGKRGVFEIITTNEMKNLSSILNKENKFIPQEVSCKNGCDYSFIETILKNNLGEKFKLRRGLIDVLFDKACIMY
jgi:hypothetical protein